MTQTRLRPLSDQAKWSRCPSEGDSIAIKDNTVSVSASRKRSRSRSGPGASVASAPSQRKHGVISLDSSPEPEQQKRHTAATESRGPEITNAGPNSIKQEKKARVKDEPLSAEIMNHTILRVRADGPSIKARGPIEVNFEVYKTSERLFTSLMSERSLKPEMQKKVSQLTATVNGKETCCRRTHLDDWTKICADLRKLWDNSPELFNDHFEIDIMLHVDE